MQLHSGKVCIQVFIKKQNDLLFEQCRILPCGKNILRFGLSCSIVSSIFQRLPKKPGRRSFCRAISRASSLEGGLSAGMIGFGLVRNYAYQTLTVAHQCDNVNRTGPVAHGFFARLFVVRFNVIVKPVVQTFAFSV